MRNIREAFIQHLKVLVNENNINSATYVQEDHEKGRTQLRSASFRIDNPLETKEIEAIPAREIPCVSSVEDGELYFQFLMHRDRENYDYTYGERIVEQLEYCIEKLSTYTNNAQIIVIDKKDHNLEHRPCLQLIDFKRLPENKLDMHVYFRSWDIFAMPMNLIGLSYLFEYVAENTEIKVNHLYCYSSGLNIRAEMMKIGKKIATYLQI